MRSPSCGLRLALRSSFAIAAFLMFPALSSAQEERDSAPRLSMCAVHGRVENMALGAPIVVELVPLQGGLGARTDVEPSGNFSLAQVPAGDYMIRIATSGGHVVQEELVSLSNGTETVVIRLAEQKLERPASGTISIHRLQDKIPGKAFREMKKSAEASAKGDINKAIDHLQRALATYPEYLEAHNNLGACYLRLNRFEEALAEFQKANHLDPEVALVNANLSAVLLMVGRYPEAETSARQALKSDPTCDRARLSLGLSLQAQNRSEAEALDNLRRVAPRYPRARLTAAQILVQQGHPNQAANELEEYLRTAGPTAERPAVESWLAQMHRLPHHN